MHSDFSGIDDVKYKMTGIRFDRNDRQNDSKYTYFYELPNGKEIPLNVEQLNKTFGSSGEQLHYIMKDWCEDDNNFYSLSR